MDNPNAVTTSPSGSTPAEAKAFLDAHPEIEAFDIVLTDANGIGRGKIVRRHELMSIFEGGRHMPISILGLDITGEDVHDTGLIWDTGDGDLRAWPVPGTLVPLHGTRPPRGQVLMSMYHLDGQPMTSDPRLVLARQVELLAARGLHPAGAFELEFFLLANERDADGKVQPARAVLDGRRSGKTEVYSVDHLHGMEPLFSDIYAAAKAQGIPAETIISEYAPGQYELTLNYRKDVMRAADDLVMLKRLVRAQARRHGVTACFMAKPIETYAGSGMHFHVSLQDDADRNVFTEAAGEKWSPKLLNALGGLIGTMAESMLVFAPHANSWRRFVSQSYAPVAPTWGVNNRSVALRVPAGDAGNRRIEHRPSGADANPYLVLAAILGAALIGIENKLSPGEPTGGEGQGLTLAKLPPDWASAIAAFEIGARVAEIFPAVLRDAFIACKRQELNTFALNVSDFEIETYLESV
ncbi:MAG: glutamine synthetase [Mesorhizobium sp.]|nr:MAG: glutamine synthetase [Mesorhizobium sp.]